MRLIVGGDLVPTNSNEDLFVEGNIASLLGQELKSVWDSADLRIFNLEAPLTDKKSPIRKSGPNLYAPTKTIKGIKKLNPSLVTLANNHILDQGDQGLFTTTKLLQQNDIPFVGIGKLDEEAHKPYILEINNIKIGVYACAEHEFTIATNKSIGANPFDPLETLDHIKDLKSNCDYVIVLYHGGKEYYRYPSPYLQKVCRKFVDKGANVVICQHSHCIGAYENYNNSSIIYGQGNFIFDNSDNEFWQTSILIDINIKNNILDVDYIPIVKKGNVIRKANVEESEAIISELEKRSNMILKEGFIEYQYNAFAKQKLSGYLATFAGYNKIISRIDRRIFKGFILNKIYNKRKLLAIQNFIECEAHRELLLSGLKGENGSGR